MSDDQHSETGARPDRGSRWLAWLIGIVMALLLAGLFLYSLGV
jgi:Mg2+ and Co2+ transporter CorA